jgi:hypothetical protein
MSIPNFHGLGTYDARRPVVEYDRTPVVVGTARNASTGAGAGWFQAGEGSVHIWRARGVGRPGHVGFVAGSVDALLGDRGRVVRLRGTWSCTIEPDANG